ncbi:MAG: O-antigen ligase family protein [Sphingobium sp.]|uniref:O-antigen ligase family protein n=1 Tax=Sphingobium sp. TaxID=1912891 RepID=UPI0029B0214B|nr:O-antigen ligase family protein [Sphingobium sp.]MDX3909585.1 O-antigen ligase family protein [Sphingobium sp.]
MTAAMANPQAGHVQADVRAPFLILAAIFLAPYLSWRPSLDILFTISDACFLLGAAQLVVRQYIPLQPFGVLSPVWLIAFVLMMAGLLVSSLFGNDPLRWPIVAIQYSFAWMVLPFLLMGHGNGETHRLARALLAGVVLMELAGVIVYFTFQGSFEQARSILGFDFISGSGRLGAFVTDANWNGATIAMALPFTFYLRARRLINAWQAILATAILFFALMLSASVTAFGSALAAMLIFVIAGGVRVKAYTLLALAVVSIALAPGELGLPSIFQKRVANALESGDFAQAGTFKGRVALMDGAWHRVGDHILLGAGVDQDRVVSGQNAPVHNMYLLLWVEGGFIALAGWITMMSIFLLVALAALRRDRMAGALCLSVLATFLLFSTASPHMYARLWAVPVILALAIARTAGGPLDMRLGLRRRYSPARLQRLERARG